jgi:hypothetical protein
VEINFHLKSNEFRFNNQIQWDSDSIELKRNQKQIDVEGIKNLLMTGVEKKGL